MTGLRVDRASDGVYYLTGQLDVASAEALELRTGSIAFHAGDVVLDLRDLSAWDAAGLRAILTLSERTPSRRIVLRCSPPSLGHVLDVLALGRFEIHADVCTLDWIVEPSEAMRDGSGDGPGAWSRWAASRTSFGSSSRRSRDLARRHAELRTLTARRCQRARSLRALRSASIPTTMG